MQKLSQKKNYYIKIKIMLKYISNSKLLKFLNFDSITSLYKFI